MIVKVCKDAINFTMVDDIGGMIEVYETSVSEKKIGEGPKDDRIFKVVAHIVGERMAHALGLDGPVAIRYQNRAGEWCEIIFQNATAYICSDSGKTIEAIRA